MRTRPVAERLWDRVDRTDHCWLWLGALSSSGYGVISSGGRQGPLVRTHRLAYELLVGPIPDGMQIDHTCCEKRCVNPAHLEPVTQAENLRRYGERKTRCIRGHDLPPKAPGAKRRARCATCQHDYYLSRKAVA